MIEMTIENLAHYLSANTALFEPKLPITIFSLNDTSEADGYINYIYRAKQADKTFIIKQSRAYLSSNPHQNDLNPERNYLEYLTYQLRKGITETMIPKTYFVDQKEHLFVMEDLGSHQVLRKFLCAGQTKTFIGKQMGEFLAKNQFATSAFFLSDQKRQALATFFTNDEMRTIILDFILSYEIMEQPISDGFSKTNKLVAQKIVANTAIIQEWHKMKTLFEQKKECLLHGDLHTSNVFVTTHHIAVIDMEYSMFGPFSYDIGYFLANILSQFAAFSCNRFFSQEFRHTYTNYLLNLLTDVFDSYRFHFLTAYHQKKETATPASFSLIEILQEAIGFMAIANLSRILNAGPFPDFDVIPTKIDQFLAKNLSLKLAVQLLLNRRKISNSVDLQTFILTCRKEFLTDLPFD